MSSQPPLAGAGARDFGQGYSSAYPIPTIQRYQDDLKALEKEDAAVQADDSAKASSPTSDAGWEEEKLERIDEKQEVNRGEDKKEVMERMQKDQQHKPTQDVKTRKGERSVHDPTTGKPVVIKDAKFEDYPDAKDLNTMRRPPAEADVAPHKISPSPASPSNILLQPFPPPVPQELGAVLGTLNRLALFCVVAPAILWFFVAFGSGWFAFFFRTSLLAALGFGGATLAWGAGRRIEKEFEAVRMNMHRERGEKHSPPMPESVEWLNSFIGTLWGLVNPDMFLATADMIEDIMQQSLPALVDAVKISDIGQGVNPFRIISMRGLPDSPGDKSYPRQDWIDQGDTQLPPKPDVNGKVPDLEQTGNYVNFEVAFAYHAQPGQGAELRSKNIHLLCEFFVGVYDWLHIPIPLWVQIESLVGTVRLRVQFIPDAPFIRNLTFTFMGVPAVEVSVTPLSNKLPNVLDLPLVSTFVKMAIAAGTAEFVAPKSMTLNMQEMLSGAAIGDTRAVGVFVVTIHHAEELSAQDRNGRSDPYIVAAYAKFGKPLYSTRIILGDLNPVWEETFILILTEDEVKADEALSLMLWDSDERTSDDLIGRIKVPVKELMKERNVMKARTDPLMGFEDADSMAGKLHWSIGFFEKAPLIKELEKPEDNPAATQPKTAPESEMRPGDKAPEPAARSGPPPKPVATRTPPDPRWASGVLSIIIHQVNGLERRNLKGTNGKDREGSAGQDTDDPSEQSGNLPSSYCELVVNDDLIYKTRVKQYSTMPFFEAGTEVFLRDWKETVVRVVVRDSALRERDPIMGIVDIKLKDLFTEASEYTGLFAIEEGIGFGRVNISLLFRGIQTELPKNLLGWETGTVELKQPIHIEFDPEHASSFINAKRLVISTSDSTEVLPMKNADKADGALTWDVGKMRLPVYSRFQSVLTFELYGGAVVEKMYNAVPVVGDKAPRAIAVVWLQDLVDDEDKELRIPILIGNDLKQLRQNYINDFTHQHHDYQTIGWLTTKIRLDSGLDEDHETHSASQARRHAFETYDHIEGQAEVAEKNSHAMDDGIIDKNEQKSIERAQKRQAHNRQRGVAGFKPYRTVLWMKDGVKRRLGGSHSTTKREPNVQSEA